MKQLMNIAAGLLLTIFNFNASGQQISEKDQQDIEKVYAGFTDAFANMDARVMANLFTNNGVHIGPDGTITRGRESLLAFYTGLFDSFKSLPKPDKTTHKDADWNTRYLAPGLIQVSYTSEEVSYFGPKTKKDSFSYSVILKRVGDQWLAEQVTMTPVNELAKH